MNFGPSLEASFGKAVFYRFFVGVGGYFAAKRIGDVFLCRASAHETQIQLVEDKFNEEIEAEKDQKQDYN
jgi:hypothetical protein